MEEKIQKIFETSKKVIKDCALDNGAIVAANSNKDYYSREAKYYFYVWPRDAAFTCIAANLVGIDDIQEPFFDWIRDRAEDMDDSGRLRNTTGLVYEKYFVNGLQAEHRYQPDQGGILLLAIANHLKKNPQNKDKYLSMIKELAEGTCNTWKDDHFNLVTNDLWEERHTFPDLKDNFTYSLACCSKGLFAANELVPDERFVKVADQMKKLVIASAEGTGFFYRSFGVLDDRRPDASLLGIIWPHEIISPDDELSVNTVNRIIEQIVSNDGLYRYAEDEYDGWMYRGFHRKKGAGYWPLLNFWLAIVLNKMGRRDEALKYYYKVINEIDENTGFIPEQIFNNNIQKAVSPLCWSHVMFLFASNELGLLNI